MKILQINKLYHPVIGGVETVVKNIAEHLHDNHDFIVDVLACQEKGPRLTEHINNIKVYKASSWGKKLGMPLSLDFFKLFFQLRKNYDLFIIHYPFPLASFLTFFIPQEKLIIYYHSDIIRQKIAVLPFSPFISYSLNEAKMILVASHNLIQSSKSLNKRKNKCKVLPFGLDINYSESDKIKARYIKDKYSPQHPLLLAVGRLVYYKGFEYAIEAMPAVFAKLIIIGSGPEVKSFQTLIAKLNLQDKVQIIPPQKSLKPFFLACDVFLFPSIARSEAFGLVQLEAMAAGKPIINTKLNTGVEEVSINEKTGITIEPKNTKALEYAIKRLSENQTLRENLGQAAREIYINNYTISIFITNLKKVLMNHQDS